MGLQDHIDIYAAEQVDRRKMLIRRYRHLRKLQGRLVGSNYDIANRCNLMCEGCLYFSGGEYENFDDNADTESWSNFFQEQRERGVNFAYIAGAEPSLEPERIAAAAKHIPNGVIFTNGIKRIDPSINYRIHISVWGDKNNVAKYRGADTTTKAVRNYSGDPRAVMVMTISAQNIEQIPNVAAQCADYSLPLTFSYFSSTVDYSKRLRGEKHSDAYIFSSTPDNNLQMTPESFKAARKQIEAARAAYPGTILYALDYDDWISQDTPLYDLDENGIAINCGNRLTNHFQHFNVERNRHQGKCCSPNVDCSDCKAYAMGTASYLARQYDFKNMEVFEKWQKVMETWMRLYMPIETVRKMDFPT